MRELVQDLKKGEKDVIAFATQIHSRFEKIHPFSDGNGRIGRLLITAMLLQKDLAPAIISQAERRFYILYLNQSQNKNDFSRLEIFLCDAILAGYDILAEPENE